MSMKKVDDILNAVFTVLTVVVAALLLLASPVQAQAPQANEKFNTSNCWIWGGSGSAGQGQYSQCAPLIVAVPGPVRVVETKVPVVVPGPVQRVEVPVPMSPAKQRE